MLEKLTAKNDIIGYGLKSADGTGYYKVMRTLASICFFIMIAAQVVLLLIFKGEQSTDYAEYLDIARKCAENGWWYPSEPHLPSVYLFGNGMINMYALVLRVTDDVRVLFLLNILFVQMMLWSCLYIIKKVFNRPTLCFWFVIFFCLLNTFWSYTVQIQTEMPFTAFAFLGIAVLFSDKKWACPVSGILLALANWIRPIALAFLIGAMCVLIIKNKKVRHFIALIGAYVLLIVLIGSISYLNSGHFVYQASTFGHNLMMSCHDDADGSYMNVVAEEGQVGYIDPEQKQKMIFKDYNEYYTNLSLEWIKENPAKYISLFPAKLFYLYATETYAAAPYYNNEIGTSGLKYIMSLVNKFTGRSDEPILIGDILVAFNQAWYMIICVLFAAGTVLLIKKRQWRSMLPLWLTMLCGTGITVLVVGAARYHFPFLPVMMICAAFACEYICAGEKNKRSTHAKHQ